MNYQHFSCHKSQVSEKPAICFAKKRKTRHFFFPPKTAPLHVISPEIKPNFLRELPRLPKLVACSPSPRFRRRTDDLPASPNSGRRCTILFYAFAWAWISFHLCFHGDFIFPVFVFLFLIYSFGDFEFLVFGFSIVRTANVFFANSPDCRNSYRALHRHGSGGAPTTFQPPQIPIGVRPPNGIWRSVVHSYFFSFSSSYCSNE